MKKVAVILAAAAVVFGMSSCSKCVTCTYSDDTGATQTAESCGNSNNEDLEADLNSQWASYGAVTCVED